MRSFSTAQLNSGLELGQRPVGLHLGAGGDPVDYVDDVAAGDRAERPLLPGLEVVALEDALGLGVGRRGRVLFGVALEIVLHQGGKSLLLGRSGVALGLLLGERVAALPDLLEDPGGLAPGVRRLKGRVIAQRKAPQTATGAIKQRPGLVAARRYTQRKAAKGGVKDSVRPLAGGFTRSTNRSVSFLVGMRGAPQSLPG